MKRNKEFIATNIQEIFNNPFQVAAAAAAAQISQPIDLQKLFMHQLNQTIPPQLMSPQQSLAIQQEIAAMQAAAAAVNLNGNPPNPLLNGCTPISTLVTNTNINVTYLNGAIGKYDNKMHQGFIAVLKVSKMHKKNSLKIHKFHPRTILASSKHWSMIKKFSSTLVTLLATQITWNWVRKLNTHYLHHGMALTVAEIAFQLKMFAYCHEVCTLFNFLCEITYSNHN